MRRRRRHALRWLRAGEPAERRVHRLQGVAHIVEAHVRRALSIRDRAHRLEPAARLRERHAHEPASAFHCAPVQRDHRAKRGEIAGRVIERLAWQVARLRLAGRASLGPGDPARRLHEAVEAASRRPRTFMAVCRNRHVHDAGPDPRRVAGTEAARRQRLWPIRLQEDIGVLQKRLERFAAARLA
ncbi:hypothetical protein AWB68_08388 [Caballeronia choica]|uniref:Uncharacterized protein n=1 Tax=Caballeronia choica TaxID=326476 RepID=A0A158L1Y1_9BURK|nr:hypothetical protein AWB68_08388 [Caballeronia choica]